MINTKKEFKEYIASMIDETQEGKESREKIYINYGGLNPNSKAKYIIEKTGSYLYFLISQLEDSEKPNNIKILNEIRGYFKDILSVLKAPEQIDAFKNQFDNILKFEESFDNIYSNLENHYKSIYKFTTHMFSSLINNINNEVTPDLLELQELITSEDIYDYVIGKNSEINPEESNIGKLIIKALGRETASVNAEIVGRVFAYVKSGYAKADLYDKETHDKSPIALELSKILEDILKRPNSELLESEIAKRDKKLAEIFTTRLNEISVRIIYNKKEQTCIAKNSSIKPEKCNEKSEADIVIPNYGNQAKLTIIYCTANPQLYFTNDSKNSWSVCSHQKINNNYLKGKSISQILAIDESDNHDLFDKIIEEFDVINISPSIVGGKKLKLDEAFKITNLLPREKAMLSNFPIFNIIMKYKPDDVSGTAISFDEIFNINQNITLNNSLQPDIWDTYIQQGKILSPNNLEKFFYNNMLIPYLMDIWGIITNKKLKDNFVIANFPENSTLGKSLYFIREFPELLNEVTYRIVKNNIPVSKENIKNIIQIGELLCNHPTFNSTQSKNTLGKVLHNIESDISILKNNLNKQSIFKIKGK